MEPASPHAGTLDTRQRGSFKSKTDLLPQNVIVCRSLPAHRATRHPLY